MNPRVYTYTASALALVCLTGCITQSSLDNKIDAARAAAYEQWLQERDTKPNSETMLKGKLVLEDALRLSFRNNRDIQSVLLERQKASGKVLQSASAALPRASLTSDYARLDDKDYAPAGEQDTWSHGLSVQQPVFAGGGILAQLRQIPIHRALADESIRSTAEEVFFSVTKTYYDALLAQRLALVNKAAMDSAQKQLDNVLKKIAAETATRFDRLRAEVDVANFQAQFIRRTNEAKLFKAELLRLLGASQQSKVTLIDAIGYQPMEPVLQKAVASAYRNRADLRIAELSIRQQEEVVRLTKSQYFPQLSLFFTRDWSKPHPHFAALGNEWGDEHTAGVSAGWDLFDGLSREGDLKQQLAILKQRNIDLLNAQEKSLLQIEQAILSIGSAEELVTSQTKNEARALEGLRLAELGYEAGTKTEVEVVESRKALTEARGNYYEALHSHAVARLSLQQAMGILAPAPRSRGPLQDLPVLPARIEEFETRGKKE